ncbi:ADP-ribosylation factor-like protein 9 [Callorhinchus milii]|nr:ADP-ribosylation factor-like protein 9 [Callorhinchus milii]|eukprot:gi/632978138/ref/XP_007905739.1/ PREDICTED: ADP-ribosylation factor-like protein 9 [Callorhinchus milii]
MEAVSRAVTRAALLGVSAAVVGGLIYTAWTALCRGGECVEEPRAIGQQEDPDPDPKDNVKQILVLGLDGSGKTSVLHSLSNNTAKRSDGPTKKFNSVCVKIEEAEIEFLEIGGGEPLRKSWHSYLSDSQALIYVVDSADHERMPLAKQELHQLIQADATLPVVVLANKQDLEGAYSILEIHEQLSLSELGDERKLFLIGTHVAEDGSPIPTSVQDAKELIAQLVLN